MPQRLFPSRNPRTDPSVNLLAPPASIPAAAKWHLSETLECQEPLFSVQ